MRNDSRSNYYFVLVVTLIVCIVPLLVHAESLNVSGYRDQSYTSPREGDWGFRLRFNYPVFPSDLVSATTLLVDGAKARFQLQNPDTNRAPSSALRDFRLVPKKPASGPASVRIIIAKGLSDASGRRQLAGAYSQQFSSIDKIALTSINTFYRSKSDSGLYLSFNGDLSAADLKKAVKITPEVRGMNIGKAGYRRWIIGGDFEFNQKYLLRITPTSVNEGRAVLLEREYPFKGPGIEPKITVRTKRSVVELKGRQLVPLTLADVTKVRCTLTSIPPYLVPEYAGILARKDGPKRLPGRERLNGAEQLATSDNVVRVFGGRSAKESEVFFTREAADHVYGYSLPLSFRAKPDRGGIWLAQFTDPDSGFEGQEARLIQITDLAVSYKMSANTLLMWVTSIHTGLPVPEVNLFVQQFDDYRYFVGKTDNNGLLVVKHGAKFPAVLGGKEAAGPATRALDIDRVRWIVAATANDSSAVQVNDLRLKPFAVTQTTKLGEPLSARRGYVFTERGMYRPGETVFFKFTARAYEDQKIVSPVGQKVKIQITGPRGDIHYSKELALGEFGTCHDSFPVERFLPLGTYTIKAGIKRTDTKEDAFVQTFRVQEYKRPRHFVTLAVKRGERVSPEYVGIEERVEFLTVDVEGRYYVGGPVKHAKAKWTATLVPVTNEQKDLEGFFFGNEDKQTRFLESGESLLDRAGNLKFAVPLDRRLLTGLYGVKISVTVLDIDGEPATEVTTFKPTPKVLVGISRHPQRVQTGHTAALKVIVVDQDGKRVEKGRIASAVMTKKYLYTQKRDESGNIKYLWEEGWMKTVSSSQPIVQGEALFELELADYGDYLVEFTYEDETGRYTSRTLFNVGWQEYDEWLRKQAEKTVPTSNEILLGLNKKEFAVGEDVQVEFHVRRPVKKCLVTLEKGDLLDYWIVDVNGKSGRFTFKAQKGFQPNLYVSVLGAAARDAFPVYRSQTDIDIPIVYFGYGNVRVRKEIKEIQVRIAPDTPQLKGKPGEGKTLTFRVTDQQGRGVVSELAVCVVDEAVLALTRFKTPDLSSLTQFILPLSVFSGDLRQDLISQDLFRLIRTKPLTGGGVGAGLISASIRKDFRPVAYFNPAVLTDESGRARVEFKLPDSTTTYRVYAVACDKGAGFASEQRMMKVIKEFFIEPSLPRFLITGDQATFPVTLSNKTKDKGKATLEAHSSKDLTVRPSQTSGKLDPMSSAAVSSTVAVTGGTEKGVLRYQGTFTGRSGTFTDGIEKTIPIHSRYLPVNRVVMGHFVQSTDIAVKLPAVLKSLNPRDINPSDFTARLTLSTTNWSTIVPGLKYLLRYPYGCVEQTSSGIIPLAALSRLIKTGVIPGVKMEKVSRFLEAGVERILSMQLSGGGFSYWPGRLDTTWWGSLYATFALTTARQAGYDVPEKHLEKALAFIRSQLFGKDTKHHYRDKSWTIELAVYILAVNKKLSKAELATYLKEYDSSSEFGKALLLLSAKSLKYVPDNKLAGFASRLNPQIDPKQTNYNNSSFRTLALCLLAATETGASSKKAATWAGYLLRGLRPEGRWHSTADTGWCLLALATYYQGKESRKAGPVPCRIRVGDEQPTEVTIAEASVGVQMDPGKLLDNGKIRLESGKKSLINYTLYLTYPDMASDPSQLSRGFSLRKNMENLNGKDEIRVGDVVRVTVQIEIPRGKARDRYDRLEYLALEDPVPAGMVPINSELKTEGVLPEDQAAGERGRWTDGFYDFTPTYVEFRDDRVRVFKNMAWPGLYRYSYLARATTEGQFWMRGSRISLMYDPDRFGKTKGHDVQILSAGK